MIFNVAIDTLVGLVPVVGDLFDFAWKANDMNMALLERHAYEERPARRGDWLFVVVLIGCFCHRRRAVPAARLADQLASPSFADRGQVASTAVRAPPIRRRASSCCRRPTAAACARGW